MKFQAFGILCLLTGALAAPMQEQVQNSQIQPMEDAPAPDPAPIDIGTPTDEPDEGDVGEGEGEGEGEGAEPDMMMMASPMHLDMDAFQKMVQDVQMQVDQIGKSALVDIRRTK